MLLTLVQSLVLASGGLLSFGSMTLVILLLLSEKGWRNGLAYVLGYVGAYALIGVSVALAGYQVAAGRSDERSLIWPLLFVLLGGLLLGLSLRNWRRSPADGDETPRLFTVVDNITPVRALALGALVTVINFKNLAIFLSAVSVPVIADMSLPATIAIVLLVVLVFCTAVIVPLIIRFAFRRQATRRLQGLKRTLATHNRSIGIWAPLVFGLIFLVRGVTGLL